LRKTRNPRIGVGVAVNAPDAVCAISPQLYRRAAAVD